VDLPESYRGETWLKIVEEPKKNPTPFAEVEEAERPGKPADVRLELKRTKRKTR
jgi:hypothetical protein